MRFREYIRQLDWPLLLFALFIASCGLATFHLIDPGHNTHFYHQLIFICAGLLIFYAASIFDYRIFKNYTAPSVIFYVLAILLLLAVLATKQIRGASSWLNFLGLRLEPSEMAKLAVVIILAKYFSHKHIQIYNAKHVVASGLYVAVPAILTLIQPDLGSTLVFLAIWLSLLLFAGIKRTHLIAMLMIFAVFVSIGWFAVLKPYQRSRIQTFLNPYLDPRGTGYNTLQSRLTLASGKLTGTYFLPADQKLKVFVPEPYTDFTFAAFGQQFGFIGILLLLLAILGLVWRIIKISSAANNNFARLFGLGFLTILFVHILINGGMNMSLMPITGIPFPFLSYGGSHLLMLMLGLGMLESIKLRSA